MSYVTRAELETEIPAPHLAAALDDNRDGAEDEGLLDNLLAAASAAVDAYLAARYTVPFVDPAPAAVREAAYCFAGERVYARREIVEKNPFSARAADWRTRLALIGSGKASLDAGLSSVSGGGAALTSNAVIDSTTA